MAEARSYLRTPYHHQGRRKGVGVDCVGIVTGLAKFAHVNFVDRQGYGQFGRGVNLPQELGKWLQPLTVREAEPGDVMCFWMSEQRKDWICHCGILGDANTLIHTHSEVGQVVEHRMDKYWLERRASAFRYPTVVK